MLSMTNDTRRKEHTMVSPPSDPSLTVRAALVRPTTGPPR